MENKKTKISIITIVYNDAKGLEKTIKSVTSQTCGNIEYIIIDGGSNDGTVDLIKRYNDKIDYWSSEPDNGIYDAMNKGIEAATGEWVNFMNAGDVFCDEGVLQAVPFDRYASSVLIYGNETNTSGKVIRPHDVSLLQKGIIMACHQSMFFNRSILGTDLHYDLRYTIYGDYELVARLYKKYSCERFAYLDRSIAVFEGGGISSSKKARTRKRIDKYRAIYKTFGIRALISSICYRLTTPANNGQD